ncbi:ClpXP protease specificity-enhancing factor [Salinisphaera orenii]|uniref:ClpXP protease specificity-enhancing factor n=1 Tax=Salinisphaera orenii TaxID=856731 RepID=UPI000F4BBEE0
MTSRRPYLIRALYDWVLDNDLTPHLLVAADAEGVDVPHQFVTEDGKITVNISPGAVRGLSLDNALISFSARFSGQSYDVSVPPGAVLALYARENGEGMLFGEVEPPTPPDGGPDGGDDADGESGEQTAQSKRAHLKVVK